MPNVNALVWAHRLGRGGQYLLRRDRVELNDMKVVLEGKRELELCYCQQLAFKFLVVVDCRTDYFQARTILQAALD